jgi:hypothetical protein
MTDFIEQLLVYLNIAANAVGEWVFAPIAMMPGWLSATLIAAVTGVFLLAIFKVTSNQRAIKRVRDDIKAHVLALKLFKDSAAVAMRAQGRILWGAVRLFVLALIPMAVMAVPVCLLMAQLALWYQARPLRIGEETVLTLKLNGDVDSPWPEVQLQPADGMETTVGPVRILSQREICWNVKARETGQHHLRFDVGGQVFDKELAVGNGMMRVGGRLPGWSWLTALLEPWERTHGPDSPIRAIEIDYPERDSWISGTNWWVVYWFVVSMISALCFRRALNVNL